MKELFIALIFFVKSMIGADEGPITSVKIILIITVAVTLGLLVLIFFACRSKSHWHLFGRSSPVTEFKYTNPLYTGQNAQAHHMTSSTLNSDVTESYTNNATDANTATDAKTRF